MMPCQRELFDIPADVAYLNCAYMSPLMHSVIAAAEIGIRRKARPWTIAAADFFTESETARDLFARLINGRADDVAIVPAVSYGNAVASANLVVNPGQSIIVLADQFPSNVYPWRELAGERGGRLVTVARPADDDWTSAVLEAIDGDTALAALPHCHWTDGGLVDLVAVGGRLREVGAALVVDVTQSLGAMPFDVAEVQPNFLVCATYKWLLGPYSMGFLYVAPAHQQGRPLEYNWIARDGAEDFAGLVIYRDAFQGGARRFDVGERANFALMPPTIAALEQLLVWSVPEIRATLSAKTGAIAARAGELGLISAPPGRRAGHFLGLRFPSAAPARLLERLCAAGVHVSLRGDSMRVTPHVYNSDADIDRLLAVLASVR